MVLTNQGAGLQPDNPGNEFTDVLPATLTLASATASPGTATASTIDASAGGQTISTQGNLDEGGELIERRIHTEPERFAAVPGGRPPARILIETSTDSEWVARCLEALGHGVIVADSNFAPIYTTRKSDRRAHRLSDP